MIQWIGTALIRRLPHFAALYKLYQSRKSLSANSRRAMLLFAREGGSFRANAKRGEGLQADAKGESSRMSFCPPVTERD